MRLLWYVLIMIGSAIGIFAPLIWLNMQEKIDQKLIDSLNLYLLAGFIVEGIILFFVSEITQKKRDLQERRERHTKDLYEVYKRIADVGTIEENKKLFLAFPRNYEKRDIREMDMDYVRERILNYDPHDYYISEKYLDMHNDYEYFEYAIEHLKHQKYKNIYKHWEKAKQLLDEYNKNQNDNLRQEIGNELGYFKRELQPLVTRLKAGDLIEGKCAIGF